MGETKQKKLKAKVVHKHETEVNWLLSDYVPDVGEVVFYDPDEAHDYVRQKNGDGVKKVHELPFAVPDELLLAGEGINSITQPATQNQEDREDNRDVTNFAPSPASSAFGKANYAGSYGYAIEPDTFTVAGDYSEFYIKDYDESNGFAVDDVVTLKIGNSFDEWAKISAIENIIKEIPSLSDTPIVNETVDFVASNYNEIYLHTMTISETDLLENGSVRYYVDTNSALLDQRLSFFNESNATAYFHNDDNIVTLTVPGNYAIRYSVTPDDKIVGNIKVSKVIDTETVESLMIKIDKPITLNDSDINNYGKSGNGTIRCTVKPHVGNVAIDTCQFVAGDGNVASGWAAASFGNSNESVGRYSFTAGAINTAAYAATGLGYENKSLGHYSHTQNRGNTASGEGASASGRNTEASGPWSNATGGWTKAKGLRSFTSGYDTEASGVDSQAHGGYSYARKVRSVAHGFKLDVMHDDEFVTGTYNDKTLDTLFSVGDGKNEDGRHNALSVLKTGEVRLGKSPVNIMDAANKGYVDDEISNARDSHSVDFGHLNDKVDNIDNNVTTVNTKVSTLETQIDWMKDVLAQTGAVIDETKQSENNIIIVPDSSSPKAFVDRIGGGYNITYRALDESNIFDQRLLPTSNGLLKQNIDTILIINGEYQITTKNVDDLTNVHYKLVANYNVFVDGGSTYKYYIEEPNDGKLIMTLNPSTQYTLGPNNTVITSDKSNIVLNITFSFESTSPEDNNKEFVYKIFLFKVVPEILLAKPTAYKSYGANIALPKYSFDNSTVLSEGVYQKNGSRITINADGTLHIDKQPTSGFLIYLLGWKNVKAPYGGLNMSGSPSSAGYSKFFIQAAIGNSSQTDYGREYGENLAEGTTIKNAYIQLKSNVIYPYSDITFKPMLTYGTTKKTYVPAREAIPYIIPSNITSLEGYGEANPDNLSEYNYIDGENEQFVQVGRLVDGIWTLNDSPKYTTISFDPIMDAEENGYIELITDTGDEANMQVTFQVINSVEV